MGVIGDWNLGVVGGTGSSLTGYRNTGGWSASNPSGAATGTRDWSKPLWEQNSSGPSTAQMTGGSGNIQGLLNQQMSLNNEARQKNEQNWMAARDHLLGVGNQYNSDPTVNATRNLTNQFLANPEAINNNVQQNILNRSANTINANIASQMQQGIGALGAGGQLDASSIRSMQERLNRQGQAQLLDTQGNLDVQRAIQRNTDFMNAANTGRAMSGQDYGVKMGIANSYLENLPQYMPDDLSGYAAVMAGQGGGAPAPAGGSMSASYGGQQGGAAFNPNLKASDLFGSANIRRSNGQTPDMGFNWSTPGGPSTLNGTQFFGARSMQGQQPNYGTGNTPSGFGSSLTQYGGQSFSPGFNPNAVGNFFGGMLR